MSALHLVDDSEADMADVLSSWLASFRSEESRRTMISALRAIVRTVRCLERAAPVSITDFPWEVMADGVLMSVVRDRVVARYGPQGAAKHMAAIRSLLRHLSGAGRADYQQVLRALDTTKKRGPSPDLPPPLRLDTNDLRRILHVCHRDPNHLVGARDLALVSLTSSTGARRSEVVGVGLGDLDLADATVRLHVKGDGIRTAVVHGATLEHLSYWLEFRGNIDGPLFPALRKGGHFENRSLSAHQFWKVFVARAAEAGLTYPVAPHDLRRWFVTALLEQGTDVFVVVRAVGHRRVETTLRYDRRGLEQLRDVVDALPIPGLDSLEHEDG
jgi:integrase/recombinase XerD